MVSSIVSNWWLVVLRGALALTVGGGVFVWPYVTVEGLEVLFAAYVLADGVLLLGMGLSAQDAQSSGGLSCSLACSASLLPC